MARGGEEAAFTRLYERYARIVHGVLLARVGSGEVEDLVQDVFLTAWKRLARCATRRRSVDGCR